MLDRLFGDPSPAPLWRALALVSALGLGVALTGCADIHPAPDDPDVGMMDEPDEGAVHERDQEEESEHVEPGRERAH